MAILNVRDNGSKAIITKGKQANKEMTVDRNRLTYYGHLNNGTEVGPYVPESLKDVPSPPLKPPTVTFGTVVGGAGTVDYTAVVANPENAANVIVGLDPNPGDFPTRIHTKPGGSISGKFENIPAGTYSIWAAARDSAGKDLSVAAPKSVTVAAKPAPPNQPPVPPTNPPPAIVFYDPAKGEPGEWTAWQDAKHSSDFGGYSGNTPNSEILIVDSPVVEGKKMYQFRQSQTTQSPVGPRAELGDWSDGRLFREGGEDWFGDILYLPTLNQSLGWGFSHHTIMQLGHPGSAAAAQGLDIRDSGGWPLGVHFADRMIVTPDQMYGRAIPIEIRVKWSQDPSKGEVEAWVFGKQVVAPTRRRTLVGVTGYFKQGQYGEARGNIVGWHGAKRGKSRESVLR